MVAHGRPQLHLRHGAASRQEVGRVRSCLARRADAAEEHERSRLKGNRWCRWLRENTSRTKPGYLDLIATASVDYVQMDVVCQGGYSSARRLMPEIANGGLKFAFHRWGTALEVVAAAQLGICWPDTVVEWLEYPVYSSPQLGLHVRVSDGC